MTKLKNWIFLVLFAALSCDDGDKEEILPPTNLNFTIEKATDGSGDVSVTATADNASYFTFYFGENLTDHPISSNEGIGEYTYGSSGTYVITVIAYGTNPSQYIQETENITIEVVVNIPTEGHTTPTSYSGMNLVWQDEFSGPTINAADWTFETGGHGWGNNELEYYRKENATIHDGHLIITAKNEGFGGSSYTSTRMITKDKKEFKYGRIDIRAMLPEGQGIWPALWMLGSSFPDTNWPACGEIDIMEMIGGSNRENTVHGTLHWFETAYKSQGDGHTLSTGTFADKFHVFSIIWNETSITWLVDDVEFNTIDISSATQTEFHQEFFFIFNVAVGGNWPGIPNANTKFPQRMIVDYVRVFQ